MGCSEDLRFLCLNEISKNRQRLYYSLSQVLLFIRYSPSLTLVFFSPVFYLSYMSYVVNLF
jgi:hypothetical protein